MNAEEPSSIERPREEEASEIAEEPPSAIAELRNEEVTARSSLVRERGEALESRSWATGWLLFFGFGPAALAAIVLALVVGRPDLILGFAALGAAVQLYRVVQESRRIKKIEQELEDPIDGS